MRLVDEREITKEARDVDMICCWGGGSSWVDNRPSEGRPTWLRTSFNATKASETSAWAKEMKFRGMFTLCEQHRAGEGRTKQTVFQQSACIANADTTSGLSRISVCSGITNMRTQCSRVGEIRLFGLQTSHCGEAKSGRNSHEFTRRTKQDRH